MQGDLCRWHTENEEAASGIDRISLRTLVRNAWSATSFVLWTMICAPMIIDLASVGMRAPICHSFRDGRYAALALTGPDPALKSPALAGGAA